MRGYNALFYAFVLILVGMSLVYYKGATTNIRAASDGAAQLLGTLQMRDPVTGNFEAYPL